MNAGVLTLKLFLLSPLESVSFHKQSIRFPFLSIESEIEFVCFAVRPSLLLSPAGCNLVSSR